MATNANLNETQYQMSDEFYKSVVEYLIKRNITLKKLCKEMNIEYYMTYKIFNRKIKMHIYLSFLKKIATYCDIPSYIKLGERQKIKTSDTVS